MVASVNNMAKKPTSTGTETEGGFNDFTLISKYTNGYRNREDVTVLPPGVLVTGSQNVLTNTHQRVGIRKGYTLDGQANSALAPIASSFDWTTSSGAQINMRSGFLTDAGNDGKLQFRYRHSDDTVTWEDLMTGLSNINFNYTTWWNDTTLLSEVLFVNGTSNIFEWNGAVTELLSATNTTGIISTIDEPYTNPALDSGGVDYVVGDVLTVTGGSGTASIKVQTVTAGAVKTSNVHIGSAGSGYAPGDIVTVGASVNHTFFIILINTVGGGGTVLTYSVISNGLGYSLATNVSTSDSGTGTGLGIDITNIGNGISAWGFVSDANHGTGYSPATLVTLTGGTGTNAKLNITGVTSGTIVKSGSDSWGEAGFNFGTLTESVTINGVVYTYDGANFIGDTTTLYGVSPDPSAILAGSLIIQNVTTYANGTNLVNLPTDYKQNLISSLNQRVFLGQSPDVGTQKNGGKVFVSKFNDFKTYGTLKIAGVVGSAFEIFTTSAPTAFIPQEQFMYISAGTDEWYNVSFSLSSDLLDEIISINRLNTTAQQAAQSQAATNKNANSIVYLSFEPIIESFGRVVNILANNAPQITDLSYPIVNDMNAYDWTNAAVFYYRKFVYVAVPREGLVLAYNMTDINNPYWEAPQVLPISRFSIIEGDLYGHSSQVSETYKLFDGTNDNGFPILGRAAFSFNNYGTRSQSKGYNEFYVEGYISANATVALGIKYDIDGCAVTTSFDINGDDTQIVCISSDGASLGKTSLGKNPLGGNLVAANPTPKFRVIKTFPIHYFYEDQITFTSEGIDEQWDIIAFGPQLLSGGSLNNNITQ